MPLIYPYGFLGASAGPTMKAARFDGTDGMQIAGGIGGGISDGSDFVFQFWCKFNGGDNSLQYIFITRNANPSTGILICRNSANKYQIQYFTNLGAQISNWESTNSYTTASGWHHVLGYRSSDANDARLYINDTLEVDTTASSTSVEWTVNNVYFGHDNNGSNLLNADIANFMIWRAPVPDITSSSVRQRFRSAAGLPVWPGATGQLPITSNTPYIYLSADNNSFQTNLGLGSNFSVDAGDTIQYVDSGLPYDFSLGSP